MIHVGVTGGIGAGKTAVLSLFRALGARTLDADELVHRLYVPGSEVGELIQQRWGAGVLAANGAVDRAAVARIVFASPGELAWLNQLIHPRVRSLLQEEMRVAGAPLFCAVPLLHEVGWEEDWSCVVAVWCDPQTQWQRLRCRGWTAPEIRGRLQQQLSMDEKLLRSDIGIINVGTIHLLTRQCRAVYERLTAGRVN